MENTIIDRMVDLLGPEEVNDLLGYKCSGIQKDLIVSTGTGLH